MSIDVDACLKAVRSSPVVVVDLETSGLDWRWHHVVGWSIAVGPRLDDAWYVPVRHAGGGNVPGARVPQTADGWDEKAHPFEKKLAKAIEGDNNKIFVFHHAAFDLKFAARVGVHFNGFRLEDTQVNAALIDETQGSFSLETCCSVMGVQAKKAQEMYDHLASLFGCAPDKTSMNNFWRTSGDDPVVVDYARGDGISTFQLREAQIEKLSDMSLSKVWDVERRVTRTLHRMTYRGVKIDEQRLHDVAKIIDDRIAETEEQLPKDLNVKSNKQMQELFKSHGITDWPTTEHTFWKCPNKECKFSKKTLKTGLETTKRCPKCGTLTDPQWNSSFTEAWLLRQGELGQRIVEIRELKTLRSSYIVPMIERHLWRGRVHTTFNQARQDEFGTVSGRLSSTDPNLQAAPKRKKLLARLYRSIYVPDDGCNWRTNDYFQQDLLVFAHYIAMLTDGRGGSKLVDGYRSIPPIDMHSVVAEMLRVERDPTAKRMNLGMLNSMGAAKLAKSLGVDITVARPYIERYHKRVPEVRRFIRRAEDVARTRGYVTTLLGRRRTYRRDNAHVACSGIVQGGSADLMKLKMVEVDEYFADKGDNCNVLLQIHDDLCWQEPEDYEEDNTPLEIMTSFSERDLIHLQVPMYVDCGAGPNWGEATFGENRWRYPSYER